MDAFNAGDVAAAAAFLHPTRHGKPVGRAGLTRVLTEPRTLFPDYRHQAVELAAVGDAVIVRDTASGTHEGTGQGPVEGGMRVGVPPTGRSFKGQHSMGGASRTA